MHLPTTTYAGTHLIIELWGVLPEFLTDDKLILNTLSRAALAAKAEILHSHFHHFGEGYGVTGVLVLAESHISIHTWPEMEYAAIDIFMCGKCDPEDAIPELVAFFKPEKIHVNKLLRGINK